MINQIIIHPINFKEQSFGEVNGINFSSREIDVIACLLQGRSLKTIASLLIISLKTVENHSRNIMLKIGCNSRDGIINHIENAGAFKNFRQHYELLSIEAQFIKHLAHIRSTIKSKNLSCKILFSNNIASFLRETLKKHLELTGFKVIFKRENLDGLPSQILKQTLNPQILLLSTEEALILYKSPFYKELLNQKKLIIVEIRNKITLLEIKTEENNIETTYYVAFLKLLERLNPEINIKTYLGELKKQLQVVDFPLIYNNPKKGLKLNKQSSYSKFTLYFSIFFINLLLVGGIGYIFYNNKPNLVTSIHSELTLPTKNVFLKRSDLIEKIHKNLKEKKGIHAVALVGCGGAGKTTLARSYANTYSHSVSWEINAETHASLIASFENLALALVKTENEKKIIKSLREIKDTQEREKTLFSFIKNHLKKYPEWLLIFDNVETFSNIQNYFPHDFHVWGVGKIILTTRDENIQNNNLINHTIHINALTAEEKEQLFFNIMEINVNVEQKEQGKAFLSHIPPFPLDILVAAYYIKATNISYDHYLKNLKQHNQEFTDLQKDILKNASEYTKTRYEIISMSIQKLIETHKDFAHILLLISIINSQNIPRNLIDNYMSKATTDKLIYNLKKYSLILNTKTTDMFSLHRNTQEIMQKYLFDNSNSFRKKLILENIISYFGKYMEKSTIYEMKTLSSHAESFLRHASYFSELSIARIRGELGNIYHHLSDYRRGQSLLEENQNLLNLKKYQTSDVLARTLTYLSFLAWRFGDFNKGLNLSLKSQNIFYNNNSNDYQGLARALTSSGRNSCGLEKDEEAILSFEKALLIYNKHLPENYGEKSFVMSCLGGLLIKRDFPRSKAYLEESINILNIHKASLQMYIDPLTQLGWLYSFLGDYKKAVELHEKVWKITQIFYPENSASIGWAARNLGISYCDLEKLDKAESLLQRSYKIFTDLMGPDNIKTKWSLYELGILYKKKKELKKAQYAFQSCLEKYKKTYGNKSSEIANTLENMGEVYLKEKNLEQAKQFLQDALIIHKATNPIRSFTTLEVLFELFLEKSKLTIGQEKKLFKQQARNYLLQALVIVKTYFPENSPHIIRIQKKLKLLDSKVI